MAEIDILIQEYKEMLRDAYDPRLQAQLQMQTNAFAPYVNIIRGSGKSIEINTMGKFELDIRTQRYQSKEYEEGVFGKRFLNPVALSKAVRMSKDDLKIAGAFQAHAQHYFAELAKAAERAKMLLTLGVLWDKTKHYYRIPTTEEAEQGAGKYSVDTLYSAQGIPLQGILGTCFGGLNGTKKLELSQKPTGTDGTEMDDYLTQYTAAGEIDLEKTSVIPANFVLSGTAELSNLTLQKIRGAREALEWRNAVMPDQLINMAITPSQKTALIMEDKLQNSLYGLGTALATGRVAPALGVRFIETNCLPLHDLGSEKLVRINPVWTEDAVTMAVWDDVETDLYRTREADWDGIAMTCEFIAGVARTREESVISIHCAEKAFAV